MNMIITIYYGHSVTSDVVDI